MDTPELLSVLFEMKKFAQEQGAPLRYLINTCRTIEHDLGNSLVDENLITICHENWAASEDHGFTNWNNDHPIRMLFVDRYEKSVDMVRAAIEKYSPEMMPDIPNAEEYMNTKSPDITFTENMTLFVGETNFQIYHTPGHCQGQLCVYIPKERVAIVGDFMTTNQKVCGSSPFWRTRFKSRFREKAALFLTFLGVWKFLCFGKLNINSNRLKNSSHI